MTPDGSSAFEYLINTYALTGALKRQQNENMTVDYTYDNHGRNISQTETGGISKTYTYNPGDLRTAFTLSVNGSPQLSLSYEYDIIGRPSQVKNNGSVIASYSSYDKNHNLLMASYPVPGINTSYTYGEAGQLKTMTSAKGSTPLASYSYSYYLDGNQESKTESGVKTSYAYYGYGALKSESTPSDSKTYTYDQAGNRKTMDVRGSEVYTVAYEYDSNNRLSKERKVKGAVTDLDFYYYDKNGNQIGRMHETAKPSVATATPSLEMSLLGASANSVIQSELRFYDSFNRLRTVNSNVGETLYAYRPDNLRLSKTLNGSKTTHIWDGQDIVAELGNTNAVIGRYLRGNGELIGALSSSNAMQYYLHNGHGDITGLTSAAGAVTKSYAYDAFGSERNKATNDPNPFRYAGEYFDNETGSIYLRARYYSPMTGRFASQDSHWNIDNMIYGDNPVKVVEAKDLIGRDIDFYRPDLLAISQSSNLYSYVLNSPNTYWDKNGEFAVPVIMLGALLVGAVLATATSTLDTSSFTLPDIPSLSIANEQGLGYYDKTGVLVAKGISDVARRYGNTQCVPAAEAMQKYLTQNKKNGEVITMQFPGLGRRNYVISVSKGGEAISDNGRHQGVLYNGYVYCNIHPEGLPEQVWLNDFEGFGEPIIVRVPF